MAEKGTLKPKDKTQVRTKVEQTKPGKVFIPDVDIYETEKEIKLIADMPGVTPDKISLNLKDNVLTLEGEVEPLEKEGENIILKEFETGRYYRQFNLSNAIDRSKIEAELKDGVLTLTLPKVETLTPRKIKIKTG